MPVFRILRHGEYLDMLSYRREFFQQIKCAKLSAVTEVIIPRPWLEFEVEALTL